MANTFDDTAVLTSDAATTGFPSPATEYSAPPLDLNRLLIRHPAATFFFRFSGHDGSHLGVQNGDLLIIDRATDPERDRLLLVEQDGDWALCRGSDLNTFAQTLRVWGVVTWVLRRS